MQALDASLEDRMQFRQKGSCIKGEKETGGLRRLMDKKVPICSLYIENSEILGSCDSP